jgi:hypothetical protein
MSRGEPTLTNPAKKFFKWKNGHIMYWDKENEEEIIVKFPFTFLPLDSLSTITGWCDEDQSGFWSNEVKSLKTPLTINTRKGHAYTGLYNSGRGLPKGVKYAKSVYIAYLEDKEWMLGNFQLSGASVSAWIEFTKHCNPENGKVTLTGSTEAKKGATTYYVPVFEYSSASDEEDKLATDINLKTLQPYLREYFAKNAASEDVDPHLKSLDDSGLMDEAVEADRAVADIEAAGLV